MELIPRLPEDIARECLIRLPFECFPAAVSVSKEWKCEIELPEFSRHRRDSGFSQVIVVMAQAKVDPNRKSDAVGKHSATAVYRLTFCEPETGEWRELPGSEGLPMFCQLAGAGSDLVVMGGWDPVTWTVSKSVLIYSFATATWRSGADMPGCRRSFFGCVSDSDKKVYVAGGHDEEKMALRTVMAYDVAKDEWIQLPDMAKERDECKAIFYRGRLHVIGGYQSDMQGRFDRSVETFNVDTMKWEHLDDFLETSVCPRTCVQDADGKLYMCREGHVVTLQKDKWHCVAELSSEVCITANVTSWQGKMLVVGSPQFSAPQMAYVLDLANYKWKQVEVPKEYSGHAQAACCLEI